MPEIFVFPILWMRHMPPDLKRLHWTTGTTTINIPTICERRAQRRWYLRLTWGTFCDRFSVFFLSFFFVFCITCKIGNRQKRKKKNRGSWYSSRTGVFFFTIQKTDFTFPSGKLKVFKEKMTTWGCSSSCYLRRRRVKRNFLERAAVKEM